MRYLAIAAVVVLPFGGAQDAPEKKDSTRLQVEITGCVKGSTLTETNLRVSTVDREENPSRRWRLRGPKALMKQLKAHAGQELQIVGSTPNPNSGLVIGGGRIGNTNIYIGSNPSKTARDPLPEQPTIDVESFEPTGEKCR
jgi:predicted porin